MNNYIQKLINLCVHSVHAFTFVKDEVLYIFANANCKIALFTLS